VGDDKPPASAAELRQRRDRGDKRFAGAQLRGERLFSEDLFFVDLSEADISEADLRFARFYPPVPGAHGLPPRSFRGKKLRPARLKKANLARTLLQGAALWYADMRGADLTDANLRGAFLGASCLDDTLLTGVDLTQADLSRASLRRADFSPRPFSAFVTPSGDAYATTGPSAARLVDCRLVEADLRESDLRGVILSQCDLRGAKIEGARLGDTALLDVDLRSVTGLSEVIHTQPSHLSPKTLRLGEGHIPASFLKGCGLADWQVLNARLYDPDLNVTEIADLRSEVLRLRAGTSIQERPLFISYSSTDSEFVDRIVSELDKRGVRVWLDKRDLVSGRIEKQLDDAIQSSNVLLVLSAASVESDWVQFEARKARDIEKKRGRDALCPIALDESWKHSAWPERLKQQIEEYVILDFSGWQNDSRLSEQTNKLVSGLRIFY
jgi:uncharacterized protein YjbI with pentapeptide repeats